MQMALNITIQGFCTSSHNCCICGNAFCSSLILNISPLTCDVFNIFGHVVVFKYLSTIRGFENMQCTILYIYSSSMCHTAQLATDTSHSEDIYVISVAAHWCWGSNRGPLDQQSNPLTIEPSFQVICEVKKSNQDKSFLSFLTFIEIQQSTKFY